MSEPRSTVDQESSTSSRRELLKTGFAAAGAAAAGVATGSAVLAEPGPSPSQRPRSSTGGQAVGHSAASLEYSARALDIMQRAIVVDMLSPMQLVNPHWLQSPESFGPQDYALFRSSGITVFHVAVGVGGYDAPELDVSGYLGACNGFVAAHSDDFMRIDSADDFSRAKQADKIGILLGIQDSNHFGRDLDFIDQAWSLGQRVSQLTYNSRNRIGNGSTERVDGGISDWGKNVIDRMNRVGMAVDVSHCGDHTTLDAFELSASPVLITHSNCRALVPGHPRCKTDEAIRAMAATGGVMGITSVRNFVRDREPTTVDHMIDHYGHVAGLVGVEHLGLGSDIDLHGYDALPADTYERLKANYKDDYAFRDKIDIEGVDHPRRCFDLTDGLIRRGFSDEEILGILGGNFIRVLSEIWQSNDAGEVAKSAAG